MVSYGYWHQLNVLGHGGPEISQDLQERRSGDHRQRPGQSHHAVLRGLLSMFVQYGWAFGTRVLKTRVPERAF